MLPDVACEQDTLREHISNRTTRIPKETQAYASGRLTAPSQTIVFDFAAPKSRMLSDLDLALAVPSPHLFA
jgi:hypothetical protein